MSLPRLYYFDFSGSRGEECRLALHVAGVDFEDVRLSRAEWADRKAWAPYGSLPVLELPGKGLLAQTNAILAYVGRAHGLIPADPWEAAQHEALLAACEDVRVAISRTLRIDDEAAKIAARKVLAEETLPAWGPRLEAAIAGPFSTGAALQVADIKLYMLVRWVRSGVIDHVPTTVLDAFPKLCAVHDAVAAHPRVAEWVARHA